MDTFTLSRNFRNFCFDNPEKINPGHSAIYFFSIEHCNRLGWKDKFGFPSQMVMEAVGIRNWRTYQKYLNDLVDWGFIIMVEKSKNQYSSNIIAIVKNTKAPTKALDKALQKHHTKHSQSTASINIQDNKEQINKEQDINSKELTTEVETFGNQDINNLIKEIKEICNNLGVAYNKEKEREFAKHILTAKEFGKFCENIGQDRIMFAKNIVIASEKIKFWKGICSGPKSIYQNYSEVFNLTKSIKTKVVDYGTDFGDIY